MKKVLIAGLFVVFVVKFSLCQITTFHIIENKSSIYDANDTVSLEIEGKKEERFRTVEMGNYQFLSVRKKELNKERRAAIDTFYMPDIPEDVRIKTEKRIEEIDQEILKIEKEQKYLYHEYNKDFLLYKKVNVLNFGNNRSAAFYDLVYNSNDNFRILNSAGLNFGNSTGSVYTELASGNLGAIRVNLTAMAANNSNDDPTESKEEEAFQRLQTSGGNLVLNMEYPLVYIHSKDNRSNLISRIVTKGTADFPEFGTTTDDFAGSLAFGLDLYGEAPLDNNTLSFFFNLNTNRYFSTNVFKGNLGIDNSSFNFGQLTLGLVVANNLKFSFIVWTFSSEDNLRNDNVTFGGQVLK